MIQSDMASPIQPPAVSQLRQGIPDLPAPSTEVNPFGQQQADITAIQTEAHPALNTPMPGLAPSKQPASAGGSRFQRDGQHARSSSHSPFRLAMPTISPAQLAFSAMQYLPVPTIVLNSLKTVVLANDAMGRFMGLITDDGDEDGQLINDRLRGQTLSQVGIDMLQEGRPVWITWETFLDTLVEELAVRVDGQERQARVSGDATPKSRGHRRSKTLSGLATQDTVVEVIVSRKGLDKTTFDSRYKSKESELHAFAKMIITVWEVEDKQTYFTLTFTSTQSTVSSLANNKKGVTKASMLEAAERRTISNSTPSSVASSRDSNSPLFNGPNTVTISSTPFPPMGPPSVAAHMQSSTPSILQKIIRLKDALLDNAQMPIVAMWKDGSVIFPNKAARQLLPGDIDPDSANEGYELLQSWEIWTDDFSRRLEADEYPLTVLLRTGKPFPSMRVGIYDAQQRRLVFDVVGEAIYNESTGELLAGVVTFRDVTEITVEMTQIRERDEERFKLICETMPQLVWTATPDGHHDFFNSRWYKYTGMKPEECLGREWHSSFHPEDMPMAIARWEMSLKTGEPYVMEYRCKSADGQWRWFLARALALRNKETGMIEKWFGTCTDVHESIETKVNAKRTRQQLLSVLAHSHVTVFSVDPSRKVTMLEGALIWNNTWEESDDRWFLGEDMYTVFNRLTEQMPEGERPDWLQPIEDLLEGKRSEDVKEHGMDDRWYRTRFLPMYGKKRPDGNVNGATCIEGVIGVVMDVTELRAREEALIEQSKEKRKAIANEAAAKEANRLKSQFLANMSHEIRTPITGVLGMAELLGDMELNDEQTEYVDNIQSSATSLLTVINDILDFSKVESGHLDVEEVQFSLSLIVKEVERMLQFAVERKNLVFQSDIDDDIESDMTVIGDPGRVRQIITNLLTNSIKFTNQGHVRFSVRKEKETSNSIEVKFVIEDTGIGIQEDVRRKLFQPFSQGDASTARRFGGTGLGLTICKNLLELMNGRITLESTVGSGTTATFWIPFHKPQRGRDASVVRTGAIPDRLQSELSLSCNSSEYDQQGTGTSPSSDSTGLISLRRRHSVRAPAHNLNAEQSLPRADRSKLHVLVVEDNPVNQKIAIKTISKLGFQVTAAWNGKEALDYLISTSRGQNRKPDIILMDVQMPIIDGYKCTHLLRHHSPYKAIVSDVPIVAMTASAIHGDREKCKKAGMDDYLAKPVTMPVLEGMLVRWGISRRRPGRVAVDGSASDCSGRSEHCDTASIPQIGIEDSESLSTASASEDATNGPSTPRALPAKVALEPVPFGAPPSAEMEPPVRRSEGEKEWSNILQETKFIDAAGLPPSTRRANSFQDQGSGAALTIENVNRFEHEQLSEQQQQIQQQKKDTKQSKDS